MVVLPYAAAASFLGLALAVLLPAGGDLLAAGQGNK
jgi:hypothetical protein